jgi:hypothetical protein
VGITFGFNFEVKDMDGFIIDKFWNIIHFPIGGKATIVDVVLNSILSYSLVCFCIIQQFQVVQERQYASGESHIKELLVKKLRPKTKTKISSKTNGYVTRKIGSLNLVNL